MAFTKKEAGKQGVQWSPDRNKDGYVFGPDSKGRYCHVASCSTHSEAVRFAREHNKAADKRDEQAGRKQGLGDNRSG